MRNLYGKQLNDLNGQLITMGHIVEQAIEHAIEALMHRDIEKAKRNIAQDDEIDQQEKDIESLCLKILMKQQPVASDLRQISSVLKMITDLERIGDQAADISELSISLAGYDQLPDMSIIKRMAAESMTMVVESINAYVSKDAEAAAAVIAKDDEIDELFVNERDALIHQIRENRDYAEAAADLLMAAKYFERIGDHASNIADWAIYSITGEHAKNA